MKFEDTKLLDHRAVHAAFQKAKLEAVLNNQHSHEDKERALRLSVRAGEILHETIPAADPEQVAAAVLFLNYGFQEPSFVKRAHSRDMPKVCAWAQEWHDVGRIKVREASLELRQIVTAANIAIIEDLKNDLPVDSKKVQVDLVKIDLVARQVGNLQSKALEKKFEQARGEIDEALSRISRLPRFLRRLVR